MFHECMKNIKIECHLVPDKIQRSIIFYWLLLVVMLLFVVSLFLGLVVEFEVFWLVWILQLYILIKFCLIIKNRQNQEGIIKTMHVSSCHQVADILANKWHGLPLFSKLMLKMWLQNIYSTSVILRGGLSKRKNIYIYIYIYRERERERECV